MRLEVLPSLVLPVFYQFAFVLMSILPEFDNPDRSRASRFSVSLLENIENYLSEKSAFDPLSIVRDKSLSDNNFERLVQNVSLFVLKN